MRPVLLARSLLALSSASLACDEPLSPQDAVRDVFALDRPSPPLSDATLDTTDGATTIDAVSASDVNDSGPQWTHDLNQDGTLDAIVRRTTCGDQACVSITRATGTCEARLGLDTMLTPRWVGTPTTPVLFLQGDREMDVIGDHNNDSTGEIAVFYVRRVGMDQFVPQLAVVSGSDCNVLAEVRSPAGRVTFSSGYPVSAWGGFARRGARLHPFLMPALGDGVDRAPTGQPGAWGYGCVFDSARTAANSGACGAKWVTLGTEGVTAGTTGQPSFREVGGWTQDVTGDGAEDIHLIYHERIVSLSWVEPMRLSDVVYDVANGEAPVLFHGGRHYGTLSSATVGSTVRTAIVAGAPVGAFGDYYCGVGRFIAALEHPLNNAGARRLARSEYLSFVTPIPGRPGDLMNRCIHRAGDSRLTTAGHDAIVFSVFEANPPPNGQNCTAAGGGPVNPFASCVQALAAVTTGRWNVQVRSIDGPGTALTQLAGAGRAYHWGLVRGAHPNGVVSVLESFMSDTPFDLRNTHGTVSIQLISPSIPGWTAQPVMGAALTRPLLTQASPNGVVGAGSQTTVTEIQTTDRDNDGLREILFTDGRVIEWNGSAFVPAL